MRIAVFHDLPSGGAKRALYEQVRGLRRLGHVVDAFVPSTANETFLPLVKVASSIRVFDMAVSPDRERMLERRPGVLDAFRWIIHLGRVHAVAKRMAQDMDGRKYDVVLVHPSQFTQAPWILRRLRTPSLYYCHEPLRAAYEPRITSRGMRLVIRHTLGHIDRRNVSAASRVAVNSAFTAEAVRRIYGRKPHVLYLGVDSERFHPTAVPRGDYVLAVGGLHPLKGLDFIIDAIASVPLSMRPRLVVAGDRAREAERRRVTARAAASGVELELQFQVSEDELVSLYSRARLVVCAPHNEPFGFVPLEAMACARPVLAVAEGGLLETVQEGMTGFLAPREVRAFGSRIAALLSNEEMMQAVADNAASHVRESWRWEDSVARLEQLCSDTALMRTAEPA